ncbi:MAG: TetR/AcrR family transcriptional regulator [Limnobacter sp.]|nr:TetR/AcrR family transcriptional regulator [Limnobacter sp.]
MGAKVASQPSSPSKGRRYRGVSNEERTLERRIKLIDAGIEIFGTTGFHSATVKGICQQAGLTERYFYESFSNAEALFTACYLHITDGLRDKLQSVLLKMDEEDLEQTTRKGLTVIFQAFKDNPPISRILLVEVLTVNESLEALSLETLYGFIEMLETLARPLIQAKDSTGKLDATLLASGLVGSILYMAARWSIDGCRHSVEQVVENAMLIFRGVAYNLAK